MKIETVSLCIVALNEEKYMLSLLNDLLEQSYPHDKTEIVLIDSGSIDDTKKIMLSFQEQYAKEYIGIHVLDNKKKIQAAGWNIAIQSYNTDVIIRIDAHTHIPSNFVKLNMENLEKGEYVSGGRRPCIIENDNSWSKTLLETENSLFGSSINRSRHSEKKQYVNTLFHGAYRREVFEKVGFFNENLLRTEDNEIHYRIRKAGYKICYDPKIVSYQYARNNLKRMMKQKYGNGYWIGLTLGVSPNCISLYHLIPFVFLCAIIFTTVFCFLDIPVFAIMLWIAYIIFVMLGMMVSILNKKITIYTPLMPILFLLLHLSYGIGTFIGLIKIPFCRGKLKKK